MANGLVINYNEGNYNIKANEIKVSSLENFRSDFELFINNAGGKNKNSWVKKDFDHTKLGWYNTISFFDSYFFRGILINIKGNSNLLSECHNQSAFLTEIDRNHPNYVKGIGIRGREAKLSDSGIIYLSIEGYNNIGNQIPTLSLLTGFSKKEIPSLELLID